MDRQQVLDLMLSRDYCLYEEVGEGQRHRMYFRMVSHPAVTLMVKWCGDADEWGSDDVCCMFYHVQGLVILQTIWFDIRHEEFKSKWQAAFMRALINLRVLS